MRRPTQHTPLLVWYFASNLFQSKTVLNKNKSKAIHQVSNEISAAYQIRLFYDIM